MSDIIDRANIEADRILENALKNARSKRETSHDITHIIDPITHQQIRVCSECDALIPLQRIEIQPNAALCVDCMSIFETRKTRKAR